MEISDNDLCEALRAWLPSQRWFAGKGREIADLRVVARWRLPTLDAEHIIVAVDVGQWQVYQVPVVIGGGAGSVIATSSAGVLMDGLMHPDLARSLLASQGEFPELDPSRTPPTPQTQWLQRPDITAEYAPMEVEQSNTSGVLGRDALVKWFRMLRAGINPDVEVHAALSAMGCQDIGECYGWINGAWQDPRTDRTVHGHLAVIQRYYPDSADGGALAYRHLTEGQDFSEQARDLGRAVARVHRALSGAFGSFQTDSQDIRRRLLLRLAEAAHVVPELDAMLPALRERIGRLAELPSIPVQRVHGDLHLGQTLLTEKGWRILDFEGEPGAPLDDRRALDSPVRDVAGMVRSFAYIAWAGGGASHWAGQSAHAFRDGYEQVAGADGMTDDLLDAYLIDKAAYEAVYETRNRPDWVEIPMSALRDLAG